MQQFIIDPAQLEIAGDLTEMALNEARKMVGRTEKYRFSSVVKIDCETDTDNLQNHKDNEVQIA